MSIRFIFSTVIITILAVSFAWFPAQTSHAQSSCVTPPMNMVGWYTGDGNPNDISATGNNGTLVNGATYAPGKVGQAFSFDGVDDFVDASHVSSQDPLTAATLDAWIKLNQLPSATGTVMEIISKGDFNRDLDLALLPDNRVYLYIGAGVNVGSTTILQIGVWYHVAGTWDSTGLRMYVNGVLENTNPTPVTRAPSTRDLLIGNGTFVGNRFFNGLIDEVEIFDRALTATEVLGIFNADSAGKCKSTAALLESFTARLQGGQVLLSWQTGFEVNNLGFHLYRDEDGRRSRITPQLITGSALRTGGGIALQSGESYAWVDNGASGSAAYWLEEIDLGGNSVWHGPFYVKSSGALLPKGHTTLLNQAGSSTSPSDTSVVIDRKAPPSTVTAAQNQQQAALAKQAAVKISVNREGWYRLTQAELINAGLAKDADARFLQLFVDGHEVPMIVNTGKDGRFDDSSSIEFYGLGIDTPSTDARTYWLAIGNQEGKRIQVKRGEGVSSLPTSFPQTVECRDRSLYFAALLNGDKENFFGAVVTTSGVEQTLTLTHIDPSADEPASIDITLQGVSKRHHRVLVQVNSKAVGEILFDDQAQGGNRFKIPHSLLREGVNAISLYAENGSEDVSLVDTIRLSYQHTFMADDNVLKCSIAGQQQITIGGFTTKDVRIFDITTPDAVEEITGAIGEEASNYTVTFAPPGSGERSLLILAKERAKHPAAVKANLPSDVKAAAGGDFVVVTRREFLSALEPLRRWREREGYKVVVLDVEDIYDEFNFGNKSSQAIKDFCAYALTKWQTKPRFLLLAGDASYDAKNYLGFGNFDLVPTKLIDSSYLETASDDWFADFDNDGVPEIAVGRLPCRTPQEAAAMVDKILRYEKDGASANVALVADSNDGFDFESASARLANAMPANLRVKQIQRGRLGTDEARAQLLAAINGGVAVVNYTGHGSTTNWRGNLLTSNDAKQFDNKKQFAVFVLMDCLNGYFHDATLDSMSDALMKAPHGAVAVWASTGLTPPGPQQALNFEFYRLLFRTSRMQVGEVVRRAKAATSDADVRRTWVLFGDPALWFR